MYRYVSWYSFLSLSPSLSFSLSLSVSRYIIGNFMYMNKRVQLTQRVIALLKIFVLFSFLICACIRTSLHSYFCLSFCLWMSVTVSGYIMTHFKSIYGFALRFCLSFSQNICVSVWLYCHWLYVYRYVSWSVFVSLFLSQWLNECSAILSQVISVRVRLLIHISLSLCLCLS